MCSPQCLKSPNPTKLQNLDRTEFRLIKHNLVQEGLVYWFWHWHWAHSRRRDTKPVWRQYEGEPFLPAHSISKLRTRRGARIAQRPSVERGSTEEKCMSSSSWQRARPSDTGRTREVPAGTRSQPQPTCWKQFSRTCNKLSRLFLSVNLTSFKCTAHTPVAIRSWSGFRSRYSLRKSKTTVPDTLHTAGNFKLIQWCL